MSEPKHIRMMTISLNVPKYSFDSTVAIIGRKEFDKMASSAIERAMLICMNAEYESKQNSQ